MVIAIERRHVFSYEDYVEIAEKSPVRVEFWEGMILDMSGGSPRHSDKRCSTPVALFEVLSPTTQSDDTGPKLDTYKLINSVRTVVHVTQTRPEVTVHEKRPDRSWRQTTYDAGNVELPSINCQLAVSEIYEDLPEI